MYTGPKKSAFSKKNEKKSFFWIFFASTVDNFLELNFCRKCIVDGALERRDFVERKNTNIGVLTIHLNGPPQQ